MKKWISLCLLAVCLMTVPALADVIWEPESSFYALHRGDCELEQRGYWVNSPEGYITLWDEPGGTPIANLPNGTLLFIYYRYQGSRGDWGIVEYSAETLREAALALDESEIQEDRWFEVWVPMEDLVNRYDNQSFLEEHAGELLDEERTLSVSGLLYCTYAYPEGPLNVQQTQAFEVDELTLSPIYVDESGREWGHVGYFYGDRNVWFCISDPENPDLTGPSREPQLYPAATEAPELPSAGTGMPVWVILAVAALCAVTGYLLFRMRRKKT